MKKTNPVGFILKYIRTEQFAVINENFIQTEKTEIFLNTGINFKLDAANRNIGTFINFSFDIESKPFLLIEVSLHFNIEDQSWDSFLNEAKTKVIIPKGFLSHLATIAVGTARGVLFAKTEGTNFNNFIIPPINVLEIVKDDTEFSV